MTDSPSPTNDRLELVLQQVERLPTLSSVAMRALELSESEDAEMSEIAQVIESDPSLTARILAECRRADLGVQGEITSVRQAIVMLGLEAVRSALLSVEVYEVVGQMIESRDDGSAGGGLNPREMILHSLAVACCAELLASRRVVPASRKIESVSGSPRNSMPICSRRRSALASIFSSAVSSIRDTAAMRRVT